MTNARTGAAPTVIRRGGANLVLQCKQPVKDESAEAMTALEIFLDLF
jgi:hypothetical protein